MRTLRRQPSIPDLAKGRGLYVEIESKANHHSLRPSYALNPERVLSDKSTLPAHRVHSSHSCCEPVPEISRNDRSSPSDRSVSPQPVFGGRLLISDEVNPLGHANSRQTSPGSTSSGHARYSDDTLDSPVLRRRRLPNRSLSADFSISDGRSRLDGKRSGAGVSKKGARTNSSLVSAAILTRSTTSSQRRGRRASKRGKPTKTRSPHLTSLQSLHAVQSPRGACVEDHDGSRRDVWTVDMAEHSRGDFRPSSPDSFDSASSQSLYPASSRTSSASSFPQFEEIETPRFSRPSRPSPIFAIHTSKLSLTPPHSTPLSSPASLPESLAAEVIDLTEPGRRLSSFSVQPSPSPQAITPAIPTPVENPLLPASGPPNTFYIPPIRPFPTLRTVRSVEPGSLRTAFTSSARRPSPTSFFEPRTTPSNSELGIVRRVSKKEKTPLGRPSKTLALCSSAHAIEPLPPAPLSSGQVSSFTSQCKPCSRLQTASISLRVVFGRKGFVGRKLPGVFDKHHHPTAPSSKTRDVGSGRASTRDAPHIRMDRRAGGIDRMDQVEKNRQWRQDVLSQAVSLSLSSGMNHRNTNTRDPTRVPPPSQLGSSRRLRPRIPEVFLSGGAVGAVGAIGAVGEMGEMGELKCVGWPDSVDRNEDTRQKDQAGVQGGNSGGLYDGKTESRGMTPLAASDVISRSVVDSASTRKSPLGPQTNIRRDETASLRRSILPEQQPRPARRSWLFDILRPAKLVNVDKVHQDKSLPPVIVIPHAEPGQADRSGFAGFDDSSPPQESLIARQPRSVLDQLAARDFVPQSGDGKEDKHLSPSNTVDRVIMWRESVLSGEDSVC